MLVPTATEHSISTAEGLTGRLDIRPQTNVRLLDATGGLARTIHENSRCDATESHELSGLVGGGGFAEKTGQDRAFLIAQAALAWRLVHRLEDDLPRVVGVRHR